MFNGMTCLVLTARGELFAGLVREAYGNTVRMEAVRRLSGWYPDSIIELSQNKSAWKDLTLTASAPVLMLFNVTMMVPVAHGLVEAQKGQAHQPWLDR